jgi:hypothetical protein
VQVQVEPSGVAAPWRSAVAAAVIAAAVALVFGSALGHPFLPSHDDGQYASAPLHLLSHAADHAGFGEWAGGFVLVNLALHALNATLVAWLVLRLGAPRVEEMERKAPNRNASVPQRTPPRDHLF